MCICLLCRKLAHIECYSDCSRRGVIWLNPFATVLFNVCSAITVKTSIPFCHTPHQSMNRSCNAFESLDFKKADWSGLCSSIKLVNWQVKLHDCIASDCLSVIIETLSDICSIHVPP